MANKFFRWVGSGNTGATSINIFNWNHSGNWEILKYTGPGISGGYKYVGTTWCPGPFDTALFGQVGYGTSNGGVNTQHFPTLSKVKSPCLFGGFSGNVAAGSWAGSGLCGSASGITYTSALQRFEINNTFLSGHPDGATSGGLFKSYNDTLYAFNNPEGQGIPLGGGVTPSLKSLSNLEWIKNNYPDMGIVAGYSSGSFDYVFSVPGYTTNAGMDDLTIKCYDKINTYQHGTSGSSPISLKCVGAYVPFSRNFGTTGYTGINAPEVITLLSGWTPQEFIVDGGLFAASGLGPAPKKINTTGALGLPSIKYTGNMTVLEFFASCANETIVDKNVKFKDMYVDNIVVDGPSQFLDYSVLDKTLKPDGLDRGAVVRGSQFVADVFATLYPGNTSVNDFDIGVIDFNNFGGAFAYGGGIKRNFTESGISHMNDIYPTLKRNAAIRCLNEPFSVNSATQDLITFFPEDLQTLQNAAAPGTHFLKMGGYDSETGQTFSQNIETVQVRNFYPGLETSLLRIQGDVKINTIQLEGGKVDFIGHQGTARIANLEMNEKSCLDLRNPFSSDSQIYFGLVSSSGVCGGISNAQFSSQDQGGNIFLERGERLFNVSTTKGGRITTTASAEGGLGVADTIPPSVSKKTS